MRRVVLTLALLAILLAGAAFYARGPIVPEHLVFIQLPEVIEETANQVGARVSGERKAEPGSVPLPFAVKLKLTLKEAFAAVGIGQEADQYATTYMVVGTGTNVSLGCTFRGRGDQIIAIALTPSGKDGSLLARFKAALQKRLPTYSFTILPPDESMERTRER
jgi:hypothetical protein